MSTENFTKANTALMPHCLTSEKALINGLLLEPEEIVEVLSHISHKDFFSPLHRNIFKAMEALNTENLPIDPITINRKIGAGDNSFLDYFNELTETPTTLAHLVHYAKLIRENSTLRDVIKVCDQNINQARTGKFSSVESFLDEAEKRVFEATQKKNSAYFHSPKDLAEISLDYMHKIGQTKGQLSGLSSGFHDLDKMLFGFQKSEFYIVAARPSMGKTAFSLNLALHAAINEKKTVAFFSAEMSAQMIITRLMANLGRIDQQKMRTGLENPADMDKFVKAVGKFRESNLFIDDSDTTPFDIRSKCRKLKAQHGLDMIVIDYLQLLRLKERVENRQVEVSEISRLLKVTAKELDVPVIALAQLNRGVESRTNRRPMLSDLRESGSIEQDADVIMMLYREDYYDSPDPDQKNVAEVIVGKNRNGPTGTVRLKWAAEHGLFLNNTPSFQANYSSEDAPVNLEALPNEASDFEI